MSENILNTRALAEAHGLKFKDCGGGHVQIGGHGVLVNYWPDSKNRTAHVVGKSPIKHCNPYDAVKLCMTDGKSALKPGKPATRNGPDVDLLPVHTNPAGVKHFYDGDTPPWDFPSKIMCASDLVRIEAMRLRAEADAMDSGG